MRHNLLCRFQIVLSFKLQCLSLLLPVLIHSLYLKSKSIAWMLNTEGLWITSWRMKSAVSVNWEELRFCWQGLGRPQKQLLLPFLLWPFSGFFPSLSLLIPFFLPFVRCPSHLICILKYNWDHQFQQLGSTSLTWNSTFHHILPRTSPKCKFIQPNSCEMEHS